jgi:uncharacterized protein (DUF1501 family)
VNTLRRRDILRAAALCSLTVFQPRLLRAATHSEARFVLVILRGALDGLAAVPPFGESNYARVRGEIAIGNTQQRLDGMFALHPALEQLYARYQAKELIAFHAVATPYRERSHFDGQDLLESGTSRVVARDGWLNRALGSLAAAHSPHVDTSAVALAQNVPLVLRGDSPVNSWTPSRLPQTDADTLERLADLYSTDAYFASRLRAALATQSIAGAQAGDIRKRDPLGAFVEATNAAGTLLAATNGPCIAVLEVSGWDTHANQGAEQGQLATRLGALDRGLDALRVALGSQWANTAMLVVTEFGRTVAVNGTRGTDHGTATCALLVGGAVVGGRVMADWPGLAPAALHEGRDLRATLDLRSICKGLLATHLGVAERDLEERIFPDSRNAQPLEGLTRGI